MKILVKKEEPREYENDRDLGRWLRDDNFNRGKILLGLGILQLNSVTSGEQLKPQ